MNSPKIKNNPKIKSKQLYYPVLVIIPIIKDTILSFGRDQSYLHLYPKALCTLYVIRI